MFNVIVINPFVEDFKLYDEWMHPTGLYFLIDLLKKNGINIYYFNCMEKSVKLRKYGTGDFQNKEITKPEVYFQIRRKYKLYGCPPQKLQKYLETIPYPDLVCVGTMMTYWAHGIVETVRIIRSILQDVPIVIGGIAAQLIPEYFASTLKDIYIAGPLFSLNKWNSKIPILSNLQIPKEYSILGGLEELDTCSHGPALLSFGCPMKCGYCASSLLQPIHHYRAVDTCVKEVTFLSVKHGIKDFAFYDDALLVNPEQYLFPFLNKIRKAGLHLRFHSPNGLHIRFATEAVLEVLYKNGFETLRFGYESGNLKYHDQTGKKAGRDDLARLSTSLKNVGFLRNQTGIYVMGGLPGQQPHEMIDELEYISSSGFIVKPVFISPVPGTALFQTYVLNFPDLLNNPLWQNDTFFITQLPGWDFNAVEEIRTKAKTLNGLFR